MINNDACIPAVMNVSPTNGNNGNGMWGGDWASWIILFLIFGIFGGYGFGGFGGGFGGNGGGGYATESILQRQLDTQSIIGKLDGITQGICDGFYATSGAISGLGTAMQQGFHAQTIATLQGQNALQGQLSDCCCKMERAIDGTNYNLATQSCATQTAIANSTRDLIENQNSNARAILDAMNQNYTRSLENEVQTLRLSASQSSQNAVLMAAMDANKAEILRRTGAECPTAAYIVQPPQPVSFQTNCSGQAIFSGGHCGCNPCGYNG